ncbi:inositol-1-monophosphatase [Aureococcus anophagefferens]|nr:inositol-1-monophosphatase [Aureococcus anophagefferens]
MLCATLASGFEPQRCARRAATTRRAATSDAQLLDAACEAARAAGALIRGASSAGRAVAQSKANAKDLLTTTDEDVAPGGDAARRAAEAAFAGDGVVWALDPIDGTANFVDAIPLSAVSVAAVKCRSGAAPEVVAGAVYDPSRDELFGALRGAGAWCQRGDGARAPLAASPNALRDAVVYAGAPPTARALDPSLRGIAAVAPKARTMRLLGSAAIMLATRRRGAAPRTSSATWPRGTPRPARCSSPRPGGSSRTRPARPTAR